MKEVFVRKQCFIGSLLLLPQAAETEHCYWAVGQRR